MLKLLTCITTLFALSTAGCGSGGSDGYGGSPAPTTPPPQEDPQWTNTINALVQKDCGKCHNGTKEPAFTSSAQFKASQAKAKLQSGEMPAAPATISAADKATLLAYLGG